jgi:hypothetical protein
MALDTLPAESLELLLEFATFLQHRAKQPPSADRKIIKLGGLWAGSPEITTDDIAEIRRELWAGFGK